MNIAAAFISAPDSAALARFTAKIAVDGECWQWTAAMHPDGYGQFAFDGRSWHAHQIAARWSGRDVPRGFEIDHLCRNRACVRPDHLDVTTHRVNVLRGRGVGVRNAEKTHCRKGHPLARPHENGPRRCEPCFKARFSRERRDRNAELKRTLGLSDLRTKEARRIIREMNA